MKKYDIELTMKYTVSEDVWESKQKELKKMIENGKFQKDLSEEGKLENLEVKFTHKEQK